MSVAPDQRSCLAKLQVWNRDVRLNQTESDKRKMPEGESESRTARDRVGLAITGATAAEAIANIVAAEAAGVRQVWMTQGGMAPDDLTLYAVAATQTKTISLGTAIVPTYPRHPLVMAQQALTLHDIAPGRLRLGVGPSHRPAIEGVYGLPMASPLAHLREYVTILRQALWQGQVDFQGAYYTVKATFPRTPQTPILISALGVGAFHLAGAIADGAISWVCPVPYLRERAAPALQAGAAEAGRATPPLIAHVPVVLGTDAQAVRAAARRRLGHYGHLPFYANMFAAAGFPVSSDGTISDALIDSLVVYGDEGAIAARLHDLLTQGLDELLLLLLPAEQPQEEQARLARLIGRF